MSINSVEGMKVGDLYTDGKNSVWEVENYCEKPTVTLKNIRTGKKTRGGVGCLNFTPFVKLVPEPGQGTPGEQGFTKFLPLGTTIRKIPADGRWEVAIHGELAAFYYGDTRDEAVGRAIEAQIKES